MYTLQSHVPPGVIIMSDFLADSDVAVLSSIWTAQPDSKTVSAVSRVCQKYSFSLFCCYLTPPFPILAQPMVISFPGSTPFVMLQKRLRAEPGNVTKPLGRWIPWSVGVGRVRSSRVYLYYKRFFRGLLCGCVGYCLLMCQ